MKNKSQWKKILLCFSPIFGLVLFAPHIAVTIASEAVFGEDFTVEKKEIEKNDVEARVSELDREEKKERSGFRVIEVSTHLDNDVYRLDAFIEYHLSNAALEALVSGVPLTIELQMEVSSPREWVWDKSIAELSQIYRIEYYALTRQYLVTNLNSQSQNIYSSQQSALDALGVISELPLIDRQLLKAGDSYNGRLRARLMIEELPTPLRVLAYLSSEWRLASEWYLWGLQ